MALCQPEIWICKAIARYPRFMKVERASIPLLVTSHRRGYQTIHSCRGTPSPTRCLLAFLARKTCLDGWRCLRSMRLKWARHKMGKHWSLRSWIWTQVVILTLSTTNTLRSLWRSRMLIKLWRPKVFQIWIQYKSWIQYSTRRSTVFSKLWTNTRRSGTSCHYRSPSTSKNAHNRSTKAYRRPHMSHDWSLLRWFLSNRRKLSPVSKFISPRCRTSSHHNKFLCSIH